MKWFSLHEASSFFFHYHGPYWLVAAHKEAIKPRVTNSEVENNPLVNFTDAITS